VTPHTLGGGGVLQNTITHAQAPSRAGVVVPSVARITGASAWQTDAVDGSSGGPMLRRQVDPRQRTPPAARVASGSGHEPPLALQKRSQEVGPPARVVSSRARQSASPLVVSGPRRAGGLGLNYLPARDFVGDVAELGT
jgi:hypothetical protein